MRNRYFLLNTTMLCGLALLPVTALANPQGGVVSGGNVAISSSGNTLNVQQSSDKAIIDWNSFNIGNGETTRFQQPSGSSIALNRIHENSPSRIQGQLSANGNVILVNPNGVIFGPNSQVNVNSLVATSSDIDNDAFMKGGKLTFNKPGNGKAKIIAQGNITVADAGLVGLVAPHVENQGVITARVGKVQLASGDGFTLDLAGDGISQVTVTGDIAAQIVKNSGVIQANGGMIELTAAAARAAVNALVVNTGSLHADSFSQSGGVIHLYAANGTVVNSGIIEAQSGAFAITARNVKQKGAIDVSGAAGGSVNISFAGHYSDSATSSIKANGASGGGGVINIVGTGAHGLLTASGTYEANSQSGTGGSIVIQASSIDMRGIASAQGLAQGGNIDISFDTLYTSSASALLTTASAEGAGGAIVVEGGDNASLTASGSYISDGGTTGGSIGMLAGQNIMLLGAFLRAGGPLGGGTIRIGGDLQGGGTTRRSKNTSVDKDTAIIADATDTGNGGTVVIWSDQETDFVGTISAKGGPNGGNGGTVETSGKQLLNFTGVVAAAAPHGAAGTWLLDPADIVIDGNTTNSAGNPNFVATGTTSEVKASDIVAALNAGTNVTVTTTNDGFAGSGNITVSSAISATVGTGNLTGSLTLSAYGNIIINAAITEGGGAVVGGGVTLQARNANGATGYVQVNGGITTHGGAVTIGGGGGTITAGSGYAIGTSSNGSQYGVLMAGGISAGGGNIIINGTAGAVTGGSNVGVAIRGLISNTGSGTITVNGTGGSAGTNNYGIQIDDSSFSGLVQNSSGSGAISLTGVGGSGSSNYGIDLAGTNIGYTTTAYTGAISINANGAGLLADSGTSIKTTNAAIDFTGTTNVTSPSSFGATISTTNNPITINGTTGNVIVGAITTSGNSAPITITSSSGNINTGSLITGTGGTSAITLTASGYVSTGTSIVGQSVLVDVNSGSATTTAGDYIYIGNITTAGGNVTLGGGSGTISAGSGYAEGAGSAGKQYGVDAGSINAAGGSIIINGIGGTLAGGSNYGVFVVSALSTSGTGAIAISGTGGTAGTNNYGIEMDGSSNSGSAESTGSGAISLTGVAGSGATNYGVYLDNTVIGYTTSAYTGAISIDANGAGLFASSSVTIKTTNAAISFAGTTNVTAPSTTGATISTTNNPITISGTTGNLIVGSITTSGNAAPISITSSSGNINTGSLITGTGGTSAISLTALGYVSTGSSIVGQSVLVDVNSGGSSPVAGDYIYIGNITTAGGNVTLGGGSGTISAGSGYAEGAGSVGKEFGVYVGSINAAGGNIIINGIGGTLAGGSNYGIFDTAGISTSGTGTISLSGTGGTAGNTNYGIDVDGSANSGYVESTGSGAISLTGVGGSGTANYGVYLDNTVIGYNTSAYTGAISMSAGGAGLFATSSATIKTTNAALSFTGTTNITAPSTSGASISTTNNPIAINGTTGNLIVGSITTSGNAAPITITSSSGNITAGNLATGTGGSSAITLTAAGFVSDAGTLTGQSLLVDVNSGGSSPVAGDYISLGAITTAGGNVTLGGGSGTITAGSGFAEGASSVNKQYGVQVNNITAAGGNIIINGIGGAYSSGSNYGVYLIGGVTTTGSGTIAINGTGGTASTNNYGIDMDSSLNAGSVTSIGSGAINLTGIGGSGASNYGIYNKNAKIGDNGGGTHYSGDMTLIADSVFFSVAAIKTTGNITIAPYTAGSTTGVGTGTGTLALTDAYLGYFTWGTSKILTIGNTSAGAIDYNDSSRIFTSPVYLVSGGNITLDSAINSSSAGTNGVAVVVAAAGNIVNNSGGGANTIHLTGTGSPKWYAYSTQASSDTNGASAMNPTTVVNATAYPTTTGAGGNTWFYNVGSAVNEGTVTITALGQTIGYGNAASTGTGVLGTSYSCTGAGCLYISGAAAIGISGVTLNNAGTYYDAGTWTNDITAALGTLSFNSGYSGTFSFATGTLTVNTAALSITGVTAGNKSYTGTNTATLNVTSAALSGKLTGDTVSLVSSGAAGTFGSVNVANGLGVSTSGFTLSGADAINYTLSQPTITANITQASLTIAANDQAKTYGNVSLGGTAFTPTGLQNGETIGSVTLAAIDANSLGVSGSGNDNAGVWKITPSAATGGTFNPGNYSISYSAQSGTLTINPAALTVSVAGTNKTYDGSTGDPLSGSGTLSGLISSDRVTLNGGSATGTLASANVGSEAVTVSGYTISGADKNDYTFSQPTIGSVTVSAAPLTITANAKSMTYGDGNGFSGYTLGGTLYGSDSVTGATLATNDTNSSSGNWKAGSYSITPSAATGSGLSNYSITYDTGALTVAQKALTIDGLSASGKSYDSTNTAALTGTPGLHTAGVVGSDTVSLSGTATSGTFSSANAGTWTVTPVLTGLSLSGGDASNYSLGGTTAALTATISPASLTITADNQSRQYGNANPTLTYTCGSLFGADSCGTGTNGIFSVAPSITTLATTSSSVAGGPYAINASGGTLVNGNYTIGGYTGGLLTVTAAPLTITANDQNKTYGDTLTLNGSQFTASGLKLSQTVGSVTLSAAGGTAAIDNVNSYTLTPSAATGGTFAASNYSITYDTGMLSVTPATLTVAANNKTMIYGGGNPTFDGAITGYVNGQNSSVITGSASYGTNATTSGSGSYNAGSWSITPNVSGMSAGNYTFAAQNGTLSVGKASLTVTADNQSKTYTAANPALTYSYTGLTNGDVAASFTGALATAATASSGAGSYDITQNTLLAGGNYTIGTYHKGTLTINPADITLTANDQTQTYGAGGSLTAGYTISSGSLAAGDSITGLTYGTGDTISGSGNYNAGTYSITPSAATGVGVSNYTFAYLPGTLTVNTKSLTVTPTGASKTYGAADPVLSYSAVGFVAGEDSSVLSGALSRAAGTNVGSYAITQGTLGNSNYAITIAGASALTISPAALTITADDQTKSYGNSLTFAGSEFTAVGLQFGQTVGSVTLTGSGAASGAGFGTYAITPSAATGGTFDASNYSIAYHTGQLTVNKATLTVTANNQTQNYGDGNNLTQGYGVTGTFYGSDGLTGVTLSTNAGSSLSGNWNAGAWNITPSAATGSGLANYTLIYNPGTLTVNKIGLTVTADDLSRSYGTANSFTAHGTGLVSGDTLANSLTGLAYATAATQGSDIGTYAVTPGGAGSANYNLSYTGGTLTIAKANLIVTPDTLSRVYGDANPTLSGTPANLYAPDGITAAYSTAATSYSNVGNYAISVMGLSDPYSRLGNYNVIYNTGVLGITPASLLAVTDNKSKNFLDPNPAFSFTLIGLKNGDSAAVFSGYNFTTTADLSSGPGHYAINLAGGTAANYTLTRYAGILTVDGPSIPPAVVNPPAPPAPPANTNNNTSAPKDSSNFGGSLSNEMAATIDTDTASSDIDLTSCQVTENMAAPKCNKLNHTHAGAIKFSAQPEFHPGQ